MINLVKFNKTMSRFAKKHHKLLRFIGLLLVVVISASIFVFRNELKRLETYGYFGIFLINALGSATIILPAPALVTAFFGGGIFNPAIVGVVAAMGATLGELTGYIAGLGGQLVVEDHKMYKRVAGWIQKHGFLTIFLLAFIPNPFFDIAGITSGVTRFPLTRFLLATWAGKTIRFLIIAYLGASSFGVLESLN